MRAATRSGAWLVGTLIAVQAGSWIAGPADAQTLRLPAGTKEVSLAGAYSVSHKTVGGDDVETVNGFHLIPHFGYVLVDRSERIPGSLEILAEPTLIYLDATESSTLAGLSGMLRWLFTGWPAMYPFVEGGAGIVGGDANLRQTNCDLNYIVQGGVGGLVPLSERTAVTLGYRFQHLSNGDRCSNNLGLNSSVVHVGFSYFFP
ncbi:MAG: acyloxyacyl hydrolase [Candidatus Rokuibacteriota bacterium]